MFSRDALSSAVLSAEGVVQEPMPRGQTQVFERGVDEVERIDVERGDGTHTRILVRRNTEREDAPVVMCMPAMGVEAKYYLPLLSALREAGVHAAATELRGKGECSVRPARGVDFGYQEMVSVDYPAVVSRMRSEFPGRGLYLLGHSLGGQLGALFMSLNPEAVDGLILVASCSNYFMRWPRPWRWPVFIGTQVASLIAGALGYFPGRQLRFAGTESRGVIQDWSRQARTGRYGADFEERLRTVRKPVLAISIENDFYAPRPAVDHLCEKMPRAHLTRWHFQPHETKYADHFRWVKKPEQVVARIRDWLRDETASATR
jgi:predicted alpha/beta hydrolase